MMVCLTKVLEEAYLYVVPDKVFYDDHNGQ